MSKPKFRSALLPLFALLAAVFVLADAAPAQNLLTHADFDAPDGLAGWVTQVGSSVLGPDSGSCTSSGAIQGTSGLSGGGDQAFWVTSDQCIPVDPATTPDLVLAGIYRTAGDVFARIYLQIFSDGNCTAPIGFSSTFFGGTSASWNRIAGVVTLGSGVGSVFVFADVIPSTSGGPSFTVDWDRFYLGVEPQVFRDDFEFESGSACHWSAVVGEI